MYFLPFQRCMNALGKTWHPEHFFCTLCGKHFGDEGFHEKDGKAYCREDYYEKFAPKCNRCKRAIMESFITALRFTWHPECFNCLVRTVTIVLEREILTFFLYSGLIPIHWLLTFPYNTILRGTCLMGIVLVCLD